MVHTVFGFGIARFFLGIGESGNFPASIKTVAEWFPKKERALATGIFNSGANIGAVVAPIVVPWLTVHYGWQAAFLATGLLSALWIIPWVLIYRAPQKHAGVSAAELNYREKSSRYAEAHPPECPSRYGAVPASVFAHSILMPYFPNDGTEKPKLRRKCMSGRLISFSGSPRPTAASACWRSWTRLPHLLLASLDGLDAWVTTGNFLRGAP